MNIKDTKTYSLHGISKLVLLVEEAPPSWENMRYDHKGDLWFAEQDGYVHYFIDSGNGDISRTVTTVEGEKREFRNVGESRAGIFNREGLGPYVDVKVTTDKEAFEQRPGEIQNTAVTLDTARAAAEMIGREMVYKWKPVGERIWVLY
jgi:hypothetical protein